MRFYLGIFDRCAAKTRIFSYATRSESGGGGAGTRWSSCPLQDLAQMAPLLSIFVACWKFHLGGGDVFRND